MKSGCFRCADLLSAIFLRKPDMLVSSIKLETGMAPRREETMKRNLLLVTAMLAGTVVIGALSARKDPLRGPVVTSADSGVFRSVSYDEGRRLLTLRFANGYTYEYRYVPPECAYRLLSTSSRGCYFNRHIRGQFAFRRIPEFPR
jgi:hypothetical protein